MCQYILTYRRTSRLSMRIGKDGSVRVSAPYFISRDEIDAFVNSHRDWIDKARERARQRQQQRDEFFNQLPLATKIQKDEAARQLRLIIDPMIDKYTQRMGVSPSAISFKPMKTRWGVCNIRTRGICFSTYLLLLPESRIEQTVLHELCHLLEPSHNKRFHALMAKYNETGN